MVRTRFVAPLSLLALVSLLGANGSDCGGRDNDPTGPGEVPVALELVASGLDTLTAMAAAPGDRARFFLAEKTGRVRVVRNGALLARPFLDISTLVSTNGERGLLGVAFHPGYATNGRFFVHYTNLSGDTRVVEYAVTADPDVASSTPVRTILEVFQPAQNHNGGMIDFGNDGFLYIALGDGGGAGDPNGNGQNLGTLLGSILRIDVDRGSPYAIPPDNPFVGVSGARGEIFVYGLRNPWRFSFNRGNGTLFIADVGQSELEEIDTVPGASGGGQNFGWNVMEGSRCFERQFCDQRGLRLPVLEYGHDQGCRSKIEMSGSVQNRDVGLGMARLGGCGVFFFFVPPWF